LTIFMGNGQITFEEVKTTLRSFYDSNPTQKVLWDLRNATISKLSADQIRKIIEIIQMFNADFTSRQGGKTAFVVSKDVDFGVASVFEGYSRNLPFKVLITRSISDASEWLGK
ncbi:MAG: hypothetical protein ABII06_03770, partial [Pseudomonadota bacterium]